VTTESTEDPRSKRQGLLLVYTGHGKGKTTAALGVVFRALGRGMRAAVVQFIKGKWKTGERAFAQGIPNLEFHVMGLGFTWESEDLALDGAAAAAAWAKAREMLESGERDIVVLDELTYTFHYGFVDLDEVLAVLRARPRHVHVVVTGRDAPQALVDAADLVTEMRAVKHPFEKGVPAQIGVDF
jgi:cob(I)alamin adenosyltransferase